MAKVEYQHNFITGNISILHHTLTHHNFPSHTTHSHSHTTHHKVLRYCLYVVVLRVKYYNRKTDKDYRSSIL